MGNGGKVARTVKELARVLWHLLKHGVLYDPKVWAATEENPKNSNACTKMPPPSATN